MNLRGTALATAASRRMKINFFDNILFIIKLRFLLVQT